MEKCVNAQKNLYLNLMIKDATSVVTSLNQLFLESEIMRWFLKV